MAEGGIASEEYRTFLQVSDMEGESWNCCVCMAFYQQTWSYVGF